MPCEEYKHLMSQEHWPGAGGVELSHIRVREELALAGGLQRLPGEAE